MGASDVADRNAGRFVSHQRLIRSVEKLDLDVEAFFVARSFGDGANRFGNSTATADYA